MSEPKFKVGDVVWLKSTLVPGAPRVPMTIDHVFAYEGTATYYRCVWLNDKKCIQRENFSEAALGGVS